MANFLEALSDGIQSRWCALSTEDIVLGGLIAAGTTGAAPILAITGAVAVARKSSDQICNRSEATPDYSPPDAPFAGGQCENRNYLMVIQIDAVRRSTGQNETSTVQYSANGKLISPIVRYEPVNRNWDIVGRNSTGEQVVTFVSDFVYEEPSISVQAVCVYINGALNCSPEAISECGDLEPEIEPIPEYDDTVDIPFEDEDGNPVNFPNVPVKWFPPCVGIDGLKVPFEIETPLGRVCGKVEVKPDIKTGVKPKVDFDLCPSEKEVLKDIQPEKIEEYFEVSAPIGAIVEEFPEPHYGGVPSFQAEPEKPILGVFIKAGSDGSDDGRGTEIYQTSQSSNSPILVVPRMGSVRFYCLISKEEGNTHDWSLPIDIKQAKQFIPCPWSFGALAVDIQWEKGYSGVYSIAKRKSCCEACSEVDPNRLPENVDRCD